VLPLRGTLCRQATRIDVACWFVISLRPGGVDCSRTRVGKSGSHAVVEARVGDEQLEHGRRIVSQGI